MYADTVAFLYTALEDVGLPIFRAAGASSVAQRHDIIKRFLSEGGLLLATDGAVSEGIALAQVAHAIHYDLPLSPLRIEQRCGRFDRFGRETPLTMYFLLDESGVMPSESQLVNIITAAQRSGTEERTNDE
jgi:ATP-dependent helicase HepA